MSILNVAQTNAALKNSDTNTWTNSLKQPSFDIETRNNVTPGSINSSDVEPTGRSFNEFLQESISKVNSLQQDANSAMEMLASGKTQSLHETLLAVEKAEIAFKTMNQIRGKVLDAYKEIMRMQI